MPRLRIVALFTVAVLLVAAAAATAVRREDEPDGPARALIAQTRANALAGVAQRIYTQEVFGSDDQSAFHVIAALPNLIKGIEKNRPALARRTLDQVPVRHAVHERVTRGSRILLDVGLKFVVAGQRHVFRDLKGHYIGQMEVSVQDVTGFVKLFHRLTGAEIIVYGHKGHAKSSLPVTSRLSLPPHGPVAVDGRTYYVSSLRRVGFAGEPLGVWILVPPG